MATSNAPRRYIIMPSEGFQNATLLTAEFRPSNHLVSLAGRATVRASLRPKMKVLDSIHEDGPKLVEMPPEAELSLRLNTPGIKIVPEVFYERQWERFEVEKRVKPARAKRTAKKAKRAGRKGKARAVKFSARPLATATSTEITITDKSTGNPIQNATVVAFIDFEAREGAQATTNAQGRARLSGIAPNRRLERVYVYAPAGYWGHFAEDINASRLSALKLAAIDITDTNLLLHQLYGGLPANAGQGVTIGIIDSGIDGTHPDLNVSGGLNCVGDEVRANPAAAANWRPALVDGEHGTHVAGTAAARGGPGIRGVAPGATLRSYRVFPDTGGGASNFDIAKAIDTAIADGCHVINMSLGGGPRDDLTRASVNRALAAGSIVVVAAGNDHRSGVSFPAAMVECVAVSAMGRVGTFPSDSIGASDIAPPRGTPSSNFVAAFSNYGPEIDVTGPGVEIVSTMPGRGYGAMSGTSMACPAVAGFAAYLFGSDPGLQALAGSARSRAFKDLLYSKCRPVGFGRDYEGFGLPMP